MNDIKRGLVAVVIATAAWSPLAYADEAPLPPSQQEQQPLPPPPPASGPAPNGVALSRRIIKHYAEGDEIPPGYHTETRVRAGLLVAGAAAFVLTYAIALSLAGRDESHLDLLYIPVVGPFLQSAPDSNGLLLVDGVGQVVGVTLMITALAWPRTVLVRGALGEVRVTPLRTSGGGTGVGLVGTF